MFIFINDESAATLDISAVRDAFRAYGRVHQLRHTGGSLIWIQDTFVAVTLTPSRIRVQCRRPLIDDRPICSFEWIFASHEIMVRRSWSGELTAYFWREPFVVSSHLRLAAVALGRRPLAPRSLRAGHRLRAIVRVGAGARVSIKREVHLHRAWTLSRATTVRRVRQLVIRSVESCPDPLPLLLSGGIDSSAIAAAATAIGRPVQAFVFSVSPRGHPQPAALDDLHNARLVAAHLRVPLTEICLQPKRLIARIPLAVQLAETPRGTIVDECAALPEVARALRRAGFDTVCIADAADDLFGGFLFALRLYRGRQLREYCRQQLEVSLPDELAIVQNVFRRWGVSVIDPYWTRDLLDIGYNLPLRYRIDRRRLMKTLLREAFADTLPPEIVSRPKCVTRDATQIRDVLEQAFGRSRERYRQFHLSQAK